jgi:hypothetical protein
VLSLQLKDRREVASNHKLVDGRISKFDAHLNLDCVKRADSTRYLSSRQTAAVSKCLLPKETPPGASRVAFAAYVPALETLTERGDIHQFNSIH